MKKKPFSILLIWFAIFASALNTFAQDYTQWSLPEGAKARLGKGRIQEIQYSPDGTRFAVATGIGIWIYDAHSGREIDLLTGHTGWVISVAFSPDGNTIVSGSRDDTIRLWDANTGRLIRTLTGHTGSVLSVAFSSDGNIIASGSGDATIRLWDANTGRHIRTLTGHTQFVYSVAFSPDGNTIASGSLDATIRLWDANTGRHIRTIKGHTDSVYSVAFSPDGQTIVSGGDDDTAIRLWDAKTGRLIRTFTGTHWSKNVAFSPNGLMIASSYYNDNIRLWDAKTGRLIRTLKNTESDNFAFSPDGQTIVSANLFEGTMYLWDVRTGTHLRTLTGHMDIVESIAFSPNGRTIAISHGRETLLWNVETGKPIRTFKVRNWIGRVAFSPDGQTIAMGYGSEILLWNVEADRHIQTFKGTSLVNSIAFSPNGQTIVSGSTDAAIHLWDARTGGHIRTFTGHTDQVNSVAYSPDGQTIVSASGSSTYVNDNTVRLWDVGTGRHIRTITEHTGYVLSVAFSPDGNTIASGSSDSTIRLWETNTGRNIRTIKGHTSAVHTVAFSPDGNTIASSGSSDRTIRFWETNTDRHIHTLKDAGWVTSVVFSPDGTMLASGMNGGAVLLWELTSSPTSTATVSLFPSPVQSPSIDEQLTLSLKITGGENVSGYQATVSFDTTALRYVKSTNGDYLPQGAFFVPPVVKGNTVTLAATALAGESNPDGTLATITFEVAAAKASTVRLSDVLLTDSEGDSSSPQIEGAEITEAPQLPADVNKDGIVNIIDLTLVASNFGKSGQNAADVNGDGIVNIIDLTLVAAAFGNTAAAPSVWGRDLEIAPTRNQVQQWLHEARQMNLTDSVFQRGMLALEQLLAVLTPEETTLLPNYPNPFNPETWIPYQLADSADVSISIYAMDGQLVRTLDFGYQPVGIYESRSRAAYWNGRNALGESVASGVYFYMLTADNFSTTRKMLIRK